MGTRVERNRAHKAARSMTPLVPAVGLIVLVALGSWAYGGESAQEARVDFRRDIVPILRRHCVACHGPKVQEKGLRLDTRDGLLRGGADGAVVVAGNPAASRLYRRVTAADSAMRMPRGRPPLEPREIALLRRWIAQGAPWPKGVTITLPAPSEHWAYRKPRRVPTPPFPSDQFAFTPVDAFILARLDAERLRPSPMASDATLLRRVYLDLIGIPPDPAFAQQYLDDGRPDKYERLVDRLLASPGFGEKWARAWLDAARYADSNGYQADQYRSVWPYRDWVIRALNADMPFDQFTIEQLAGDLLPSPTIEQRVATGFARLTTCNVEAGVDPEKNRVDQVVDRVNTLAVVWLGTTLECAQCHDHKYDPFTMRDYYQLFAFFNNTPIEVKGDGVTYNFYGPKMELPLPAEKSKRRKELTERLARLKQSLSEAVERVLARLEQEAEQPGASLPAAVAAVARKAPASRSKQEQQKLVAYAKQHDPEVRRLAEEVAALQRELQQLRPPTTLVMVELLEPRRTHILQRGDYQSPGEPVEPDVPAVLPPMQDGWSRNRLGLARWLVDPENPLVARVTVNRWWAELFGRGIVPTVGDFGTQGEPPSHPKLLDWLATELIRHGWSRKRVVRLIVTSAVYRRDSRATSEQKQADPENRLLARAPRLRLAAETIRDQALAASGLLSYVIGGPPVYPPQPPGIWRHVGRNAPKYRTSSGADRFRRGVYVIWRRSAPYPSFVNFDAPDRTSCVVQRPVSNTPLQALTLMNDRAYAELALGLAARTLRAVPAPDDARRVSYAFRCCLVRQPDAEELAVLRELVEQERAELRRHPDRARARVAPLAASVFGFGVNRLNSEQIIELATYWMVANVLLNLDETIVRE